MLQIRFCPFRASVKTSFGLFLSPLLLDEFAPFNARYPSRLKLRQKR